MVSHGLLHDLFRLVLGTFDGGEVLQVEEAPMQLSHLDPKWKNRR